jgi:hypothetical protein
LSVLAKTREKVSDMFLVTEYFKTEWVSTRDISRLKSLGTLGDQSTLRDLEEPSHSCHEWF